MPSPLFTVTDASSATMNQISYSNVNAGSSGAVVPLLFWNNLGGTTTLPDAVQVSITTKTFNGYYGAPDNATNGLEIVTQTILTVQCTSQDDPTYTPIGGPVTWPISDGSEGQGIISGAIGGTFAYVNTQIVAPPGVSAGPAAFLIRLGYMYS